MKNAKYNILIYFDNHTYRKIAIDVNSSYAENFIDKKKHIFQIQFISGLVYRNNFERFCPIGNTAMYTNN